MPRQSAIGRILQRRELISPEPGGAWTESIDERGWQVSGRRQSLQFRGVSSPGKAATTAAGAQTPSRPPPLQLTNCPAAQHAPPESPRRTSRRRASRASTHHTHLTSRREGGVRFRATPEELLEVMDRRRVRRDIDLTSGAGGITKSIERSIRARRGRFATFTEPTWARAPTGCPSWQAEELAREGAGARGVKIAQDTGPLPARRRAIQRVRRHRQSAVRPDVGCLRPARAASGHPRLDPKPLPADQWLQRRVTGAGEPPGRSTRRVAPAISSWWRPATACSSVTRRRRSSRCTSGTTPRT